MLRETSSLAGQYGPHGADLVVMDGRGGIVCGDLADFFFALGGDDGHAVSAGWIHDWAEDDHLAFVHAAGQVTGVLLHDGALGVGHVLGKRGAAGD